MKKIAIVSCIIAIAMLGIQFYDGNMRTGVKQSDGSVHIDGILVDITIFPDGSKETYSWTGGYKMQHPNGDWEEYTYNSCGQRITTADYKKCTGRIRTLYRGQLV